MATTAKLGTHQANCPECGVEVTEIRADTETVWVLREEYAGMVGLPVNEQYGRRIPVRSIIHLSPCGHEVSEIQIKERT